MARYTLGWSRDKRGRVVSYSKKNICNIITTFSCSSHTTSIYIYEDMGNYSKPKIKQICNILENKGFDNPETGRIYDPTGICPTLSTMQGGNRVPKFIVNKVRIRKFTPREVGRFMGVRDSKIDILLSCGVSNSALYKMFDNSIIVDNLVAVFNNMFYPEWEHRTYKAGEQLTLW